MSVKLSSAIKTAAALLPDDRVKLMKAMERYCSICGRVHAAYCLPEASGAVPPSGPAVVNKMLEKDQTSFRECGKGER